MAFEKVLYRNLHLERLYDMDVYLSSDGYHGLAAALERKPDEVIEEVKASGLRGRGGAGFPTGVKWGFLPKVTDKPKYLCVNADEGEPGTFKDRELMEKDPHSLLEGMIIAGYALGVHKAFLYIRGEYHLAIERCQKAIDQLYARGYLGSNVCGKGFALDIIIHKGAGAYICGEETALINSIEGKRGEPRLKPPFPATSGLWACPTVVNNVETLCAVPWILAYGAKRYREFGTEKSPGTKIFSVSGCVSKPGNYELPLGTPFKVLLEDYCGGVWKGKKLKGVIPGGSSVPLLSAAECEDLNLDYESVQARGSLLGCGAVIVYDEDVCVVEASLRLAEFYAHESCGQCAPCREGTHWLAQILERIEHGQGRPEDLPAIEALLPHMKGMTICVLADSAAAVVESTLKKFRNEYEAHIKHKGCPHKKEKVFAYA